MKNYNTYVQEANLLCSRVLQEKNAERTSQKLTHMQQEISHSDLTVYQKEFLMRKLDAIQESAYA